ncbi:hypothetical protein QBC47DRAFT_310338 [Echria macrotheca]|uniref:Uncharacterized protein n=1 Tax=Echria macrotheca TaxID=438768 RepID=A0AAJ0F4E4_9PEZI|nr:hypothetical protein QBC47DRAFT_310338 [Echria macrotheca]
MSTETMSSLFPDRPIRPLPRRRLRERLSPEVANSIHYPEPPKPANSLFSYPFALRSDETGVSDTVLGRERGNAGGPRPPKDLPHEQDGEESALRQDLVSRLPQDIAGRLTRPSIKTNTEHGRSTNPQLPLSAASSADGYDSLENTNNKKKRKIPTTADAALSNGHSLAEIDIGPLSLSSPSHSTETYGESPATSPLCNGLGSQGPGSQNLAGPGRGRYGRPRSGRSPLRPLSDSTNNWAGRNGKLRPAQWTPGTSENLGIISTAIANAGKLAPHSGQENTSLLHREQSKQSPVSSQFTFTCGSQVPSVGWSQPDRGPSTQSQPPAARPVTRNWSHNPPATQPNPTPSFVPEAGDKETVGSSKNPTPQNPATAPRKTSRRSLAKEYDAAAKARRRQTQISNKRHPPNPEDVWVCHFCEYEAIYGEPPEALIRQYEIKDHKQRLLAQQRRAQLERMRKGKSKSKKNSKAAAKASQGHDQPQSIDDHDTRTHSNYSQGTHSEEYYDEEEYEDDGYEPEAEAPMLENAVEVPVPGPSAGGRAAPLQASTTTSRPGT